ncbi:NAD(P)H-quinone oxidoreductase subunit 5 chloroplastic [Phtheirospermum japonicum]|uniref:NAD(P)H-quinone oxidoreductase subunit 5 chloroplastic n=1 Tax=Phtheirospermum japonicum TaxID=374723 RepID=A0A830CKG8_9LAMI|nr:NAD(P)H-quinone oxidoreductase subunit 5 chloroplastic [Phtheirospermum japonicum]
MVVAGVFLVACLLSLFIVIPYIMNFISLIEIITVLLGATLALAQKDFSLFDNVSIGLYDVSSRNGVLLKCFISLDYSCLFQSIIIFRAIIH